MFPLACLSSNCKIYLYGRSCHHQFTKVLVNTLEGSRVRSYICSLKHIDATTRNIEVSPLLSFQLLTTFFSFSQPNSRLAEVDDLTLTVEFSFLFCLRLNEGDIFPCFPSIICQILLFILSTQPAEIKAWEEGCCQTGN